MTRDELTKEEIEVLLRPDQTVSKTTEQQRTSSRRPISLSHPQLPPDGDVTENHLRGLQQLHQPVAAGVSKALSEDSGVPVDVALTSVEVSTYGDFAMNRPMPSCYVKLQCRPQSNFWVLDVQYQILFPLLDCLLGGPSQGAEPVRRPLTEIERRLAHRIVRPWLAAIEEAWEPIQAIELAIDSFHHNPQQQRIIPPGSSIIWLTFEARVGSASGPVELCIPTRSVSRVANRISRGKPVDSASVDAVQLVAVWGEARIESNRLETLKPGDLLMTDIAVGQPLTLMCDGEPAFHAQAGSLRGQKAVKVGEPIDAADG